MKITALSSNHDRQNFNCGRLELNEWLANIAGQHQTKGLSKTYIAVETKAPNRICAYFSLTLAEIENRHLPEVLKKYPRRIPGIRLGRLAVDLSYQGKGLGELLLVDAKDEKAAAFYRKFGFQSTPDNPLLLFLKANSVG